MADIVVNPENTNSKELLGQGIRAFILQDYNSAVTALSKASELLVTEHGDDQHESLADVYLYYGKSLLGLSREEAGPLGDAIPKNKEDSSSEEEEEENTETEGDENKANGVEINGQAQTKEVSDDTVPSEEPSTSTQNEGETSESTDDTSAKPAEDEEPSDLQLAWEVLELAKKIYLKQGDEGRKNLAETMVVLGEVALESENFPGAIEDIKQGLEIQKKVFKDDSRTVAETFYKLGMAYSTNSQFDDAIECFNDARKYLLNRVTSLEKGEDKEDMYEQEIQDEIKEIKALIPDIEEKITDMKTYKDEVCQCDIRTTIRQFVCKPDFCKINIGSVNEIEVRRKPTLEAALEQTLKNIISAVRESNASHEANEPSSSSSSKPATDISHLVKKKRKLDEIAEENEKDDSSPAKKPAV